MVLVLLVLTACAGSKTPASSGTAEPMTAEPLSLTPTEEAPTPELRSSVVVLSAMPVSTLDPYLMAALHPDGSVVAHLWDTLIWLNDDLELEPGLAQSWRLINDLTWEVTLRQGITFHNGEPCDAEAVRFSVERARTLPGSLETFATDVELESVEVVDDYTVRFRTHEPVANLPYYLASLEILPPVYYGERGANEVAAAPVGSGPYQFVEWQADGRLVLKAASNYWAGPPAVDTLIFQSVADASQRVAELAAGRADLVTDLTPDQAATWDSSLGRLEAIESTRRIFIGMRVEDGTPLTDKRVRQALNYAIDVPTIVEDSLGGYGQRYGSWVNPPNANADLVPWPFDANKARDLLAEAGYAQGFAITLDTPTGRYHQDQAVAQAIAEQLGQVGVKVKVRAHDWPTYVESYLLPRQMAPLFLLGLNSRGNGLEDTSNLSFSFPFNPTGWQNSEFEQLLQEARTTFNERHHQALLNQAQAIAYDEAPWIWLWRQYDFYGVSQGLDWTPRRDGLVYLYKPVTASSESTE